MKRFVLIAWLIGAAASAYAANPVVSNVQARQLQDEDRNVEITYTLTDSDSGRVYVSVAISNDGGSTYSIVPTSVTGDIGWVRPGGTRRIIWDARADYATAQWSNCKARVTADDSSGGVYPGQMVYIPAGSFLMGNNGSEPYSYSWELPQHSVYLSGYWIGRYEVTRGEYRAFMNAGGYSNPAYWSSDGWYYKSYYGWTEPRYWAAVQDWGTGSFTQTENHPVVGVSYYEAEAFCNWAGGHLPTEAQWEKAARWTGSYPNVYPWGNVWDYEKCNNDYDQNPAGGGYARQTAPVGSYASGVSPYGCHDMAGNVWEWCKDWCLSDYYSQSPAYDPEGPISGSYRVLRGGSWYGDGYGYGYAGNSLRCAARSSLNPSWDVMYFGGFRLAR